MGRKQDSLSLAALSACTTKTNAFFSIQLIYSCSLWQNRTEFSRCKYFQLNFRVFDDVVICILWDFSNLSGDVVYAFSNPTFLPWWWLCRDVCTWVYTMCMWARWFCEFFYLHLRVESNGMTGQLGSLILLYSLFTCSCEEGLAK